MRRPALLAAATALALLAAVPGTQPADAAGPRTPSGTAAVRDVCGTPAPGNARCFAKVRTDLPALRKGVRAADAPPPGYSPAELRSAYNLPTTGGDDQTVAIVDAGDGATAEADLAVYRQTYGLPPCTTANGCFRKVNQEGKPAPLPANMGWGVEIALDLDMVSAACPACKILLVESDFPSEEDLAAAENTAAALGATEISNSFGATEQSISPAYAAAYNHPGVAITVSSGDTGYVTGQDPASYTSVIAVGGTTLTKAANARGWAELAWGPNPGHLITGGAGSSCSAWIAKPAWQHDPDCPGRMVADIAAVADPETGVAVYFTGDGAPGWIVAGGTSASSPYVAGIIALSGHPERNVGAARLYANAGALNDVTAGTNALLRDCGDSYLCNAKPGYDGPTGLGTPNGIGAF